MKNDLNDRLQWLEEELWNEEDLSSADQDFDLDDILSEFMGEEEAPQSAPSRNRAVEFDRMAFGDESFDESAAVLVTRKKTKAAPEKKQPREKRKGTGGLVVLAVLEVIAIIAVLLRWALWFL